MYTNLRKTLITLSIAAISTLSANDFNDDGYSDLVFQNSNGYVKTWELDSNGARVEERWLTNLGSTDWEIYESIVDLDNDGDVDILIQNKTNGYLKTLQMNDFALDSIKWTGNPAGVEWEVVGISDIDGDNYPDIILQHSTSGYIKAFKMDVDSKGTAQWIGNPGSADWEVEKVIDIDSDGIADIVMRNKSLGYVKAFKLSSDFSKTDKWIGSPGGADWILEDVKDIDGDTVPDILFASESYGYLKAFKLASDFSYTAKWIGNPGSNDWDLADITDVDGDDIEDIILRSESLGYVKAFNLSSDFSYTAKWIGNPGSSDWEIVSIDSSSILFQSESLSYLKAFDLDSSFASTVRWVGNPGTWNLVESEAATSSSDGGIPPVPELPTPVSGKLVDPYISGAVMCQDTNDNASCDSDEPTSTATSDEGDFTFNEELTPGKNVIIKTQGSHLGETYDLDISGVVASDGTIDVVSPLTTLETKEITSEQIAAIINSAAANASVSGWSDLSASDISSDPLSGGLLSKSAVNITDSDLRKILVNMSVYGLLKVMKGSTTLNELSGNELYVSGTTSGGAVNIIATFMLQNLAQFLNSSLLSQLSSTIDSAKTTATAAVAAIPGAPTIDFDSYIASVTAEDIISTGVVFMDRFASLGYTTCNATSGDADTKVTAALAAVQSSISSISSETMNVGIQMYALKNGSSLAGIANYIDYVNLPALTQGYSDYASGNYTTYRFSDNTLTPQ